METIQIKEKCFKPFISEREILVQVKRVAQEISRDLEGTNPLMLCVLNGSFMFAADLIRDMTIPCEISFVKLSSYVKDASSGKVKELIGVGSNVEGRTVVIVEDIVESGITMQHMLQTLKEKKVKEVRVATLLTKPNKLEVDLKLDYVAMEIPDDFIVGYGLDYDGYGRNYRDIYTIVE